MTFADRLARPVIAGLLWLAAVLRPSTPRETRSERGPSRRPAPSATSTSLPDFSPESRSWFCWPVRSERSKRTAESEEPRSVRIPPPAVEDGFGSCATEASEPRQVRKEAAIRRRHRAPQVNLSPSSAAGKYWTGLFSLSTHLSLPRKWRPRTFPELVGQDSVARTLTNAISEGKTASAYLLTGPRGVGKTSTARLLARCLNCDRGPTVDPCGECASCREILERGESLDVQEMDGASNRKIENARELIETVRYAPQRDRFRIAIIDEVHMLTTEAFNALLKTLEEPPAHVPVHPRLDRAPQDPGDDRLPLPAVHVPGAVGLGDRAAARKGREGREDPRGSRRARHARGRGRGEPPGRALAARPGRDALRGQRSTRPRASRSSRSSTASCWKRCTPAIAVGRPGRRDRRALTADRGGEDPRHVLKEFMGCSAACCSSPRARARTFRRGIARA